MNWNTPANRLALLELLVRGTLKRRRSQATAWDALAELPWSRLTGRRDELALVETRRVDLVALIDRVWPNWAAGLAALTARGLLPTPDGWTELEDAERAEGLPVLPDQVNRHTAASLVAPHSKATLTERRLAALGDVEPTYDGSVRLRPPKGLVARTSTGAVDLTAVAAVLGEVSLPERAMKAGLVIEGPIRAVLLVENLGAFCDLPSMEGWLVAYVAGWDTATVQRLIRHLDHVPAVHFGDLDPNGVRIYQHLRDLRPDLRWFVPGFWDELVSTKGQPGPWPEDIELTNAPQLVQRLARQHLWLEQEPVVVDPRTPAALEATLTAQMAGK